MSGQSDAAEGRLRILDEDQVIVQGGIMNNNPPMTATIAKVQYSEARVTVLTQDVMTKTYVMETIPIPCGLDHFDRGTAEVMYRLRTELYDLVGVSDETLAAFRIRYVVHAQDRCSSNEKQVNASKINDAQRWPSRTRLALADELHPVASNITKVLNLTSADISGVLALAIAQQGPDRLPALRRIMGERRLAMLRIVRSSIGSIVRVRISN